MDHLLTEGLSKRASDFHLKAGHHPVLRIDGELVALEDWPPIAPEELERFAQSVMRPRVQERFEREGGVDVEYTAPAAGRFRASLCRASGELSVALRAIPSEPPTIEALNLASVVPRLAMEPRGLVLVTGPAGSGKTTTLAAMIHYMNQHRRDHIVTIEDPIEYRHQSIRCVITQREVGSDTPSFLDALRICLRQDPNVIVVGEMRDPETIRTVLTLAETGHLVLSTLHTLTATETINRIVAELSGKQEGQVRRQLAQVIRGVISQRLVDRADGSGRLPVVEVLIGTRTIQRCIEDPSRTAQIPTAIAEGRDIYGMQTFDQCVLDYHQRGLIRYEDALCASTSPADVEVEVQRRSMATDLKAAIGVRGKTGALASA